MINFFAPMNHLGVGVHSFGVIRAYEALGNEVCLIPPFGAVRFQDENISRWLARRERFSKSDPSVMIFDIPFFFNFSGTPKIGFAVFETDGFNAIQLAALKSCDFLLTPSSWGKRVLDMHGLASEIVPEGFDASTFPVGNGTEYRKTCFVHVGKYEERKGTESVIRCFAGTLQGEESMLIMHAHNPFMQDANARLANLLCSIGFRTLNGLDFFSGGLEVKLTPCDSEAHAEVGRLYRMADCGIFPSKGEGWGLPIMECLASGTPVISGAWTAMGDYLDANYPKDLLLQRFELRKAEDGHWFHGDRGSWYIPEEIEIAEKIRWAHANARGLRRSDSWKGFVDGFRAMWTWENAARKLQGALVEFSA